MSSSMNDSQLARLLQEEYDREAAAVLLEEDITITNSQQTSSTSAFNNKNKNHSFEVSNASLTSELSPVDPSLELSDPNPDIRLLFLHFNTQFFWGSLSGIEVKWSPRMTLCAGLCVYEGRGGLCSVRLSLPLLKLRPRKDLVETLLHEMIHAYLFVTHNDSDHGDHGPNFHSHMQRINKATGANISVYHTFGDEVESYQQHWWRCNGSCQKKAPYFGYVKRSMNRAPSARDLWWADHLASCGGEYTKVKEPEGFGQKKKGKESKPVDPSMNLKTLWGQGHVLGSSSNGVKTGDRNLTMVKTSTNSSNRTVGIAGSSLSNQITRKTSVIDVTSNSKSSYDSLFAPLGTKTSTNFLPSKQNGSSSSDTTFQKLSSHNETNKHSTWSNSDTKPVPQSSSKVSDICNKLPGGNTPNQTFSDHDDGLIDLTISSDHILNQKTGVLKTHSGNKIQKILGRNKNSSSTRKSWRNTPTVSNKKVIFPKNFVSVCEGGDFPTPLTSFKRKKKVYIMDELDSNDGLWKEIDNSDTDVDIKCSSGDEKQISDAVLSSSVNKKGGYAGLKDGDDANIRLRMSVPETSSSYQPGRQKNDAGKNFNESDKKKPGVNKNNLSTKLIDKTSSIQTIFNIGTKHELSDVDNQSPVSEHEIPKFTGQGHKLGAGECSSSVLSQIRKNWHSRSRDAANPNNSSSYGSPVNKHFKVSQLNQTTLSLPLLNKKRSLEEAFGDQDSSIRSRNIVDKETSSNVTAGNVCNNEANNTLPMMVNEVVVKKVACPSCTVMVSLDEINSHLDLCLL